MTEEPGVKYLGKEDDISLLPEFRKPDGIFEYAEHKGKLYISDIMDLNWVDKYGRQYAYFWRKANRYEKARAEKAGLVQASKKSKKSKLFSLSPYPVIPVACILLLWVVIILSS